VRPGADKISVEMEAKSFVAKGLMNILSDIQIAAININQLVDLQATTLESLASQVDVVQSRLSTMKSQHLQYGLDEMRHASSSSVKTTNALTPPPPPLTAVQAAVVDTPIESIPVENDDSTIASDESSVQIDEISTVYKRVPLAER
jgi:hypothetical protein